MERSDLPTVDPSRIPPHLHQARAGALPLPAQCLPPTLTSAPAVYATPAQGAAPGPSGAALPGVPELESQGQPPPPGAPPRPPAGAARTGPPGAAQTGRAARRVVRRWSAVAAARWRVPLAALCPGGAARVGVHQACGRPGSGLQRGGSGVPSWRSVSSPRIFACILHICTV